VNWLLAIEKNMLKLAYVFIKIGLLTVGGGLAMIPVVQHEMVTRGWLTQQQFLEILGVSQMTPGPLAVNTATFVGYRVTSLTNPDAGFWLPVLGALCCTIAVCLPSVLCVNLFGKYWDTHRNHPCLQRIFDLLRPIVTGLVAVAGITLIVNSLWNVDALTVSLLKTRPDLPALVIAAIAFVLTAFTQVSPVRIVFAGLAAGLLVGMMG
jgi:chromate transporter